jgi:hypothetical protein
MHNKVTMQFCGSVQVELLEWADDLEMQYLKCYGATINYRMGVPLLDDVVQSMERAMSVDSKFSLSLECMEYSGVMPTDYKACY